MELATGAKVINGEIIVTDGNDQELITIKALNHINLFINNKPCEINQVYEINSLDTIMYTCEKIPSKREVNVIISEDRMRAYMTVVYAPEIQYKLKDRDCFLNLALATEIEYQKNPEPFSTLELRQILKENGVIFGIKEETLEKLREGCVKEILVAEGEIPIKDKQSELKLFFTPTQMFFPDSNSDEKIDYKNLFRISNVSKGDKIAEIIPEVIGTDGIDVCGNIVEREYVRKIPINIKNGCIVEENNIIATINGKAHVLNRNISVNHVHTVESVNMESCNINFYGDIEVYNSVDDNMSVSAGGSLDVSENINTSNVVTGGEINILGNALNSKILAGQYDMAKKEYCDILIKYKNIINRLIHVSQITNLKKKNLVFGEFIKNTAEEMFINLSKLSLNVISMGIKNKIKDDRIARVIKDNLLGYNILNLKSSEDLIKFRNMLENDIDYYNKNIIIPLDIRISYCQDCEIKSTGNVIICGQGQYTSKITAMQDILFTKSNSVARGGKLSAGRNISLGIVGSKACVPTVLEVPKSGKISAMLAYQNTIFCFGKSKMILDEVMENIHVLYNEEKRRIEVRKSGI